MPWQLKQINDEWCVVKEGESTPVPGGCHGKDKGKATAHMKALYASENKEAGDGEETQEKGYTYVPGGIFTFKDLDAYQKSMEQVQEVNSLTNSLRQIIDNIMYFPEIKDKSRALRSLVDEFANRIDNVETKELGENVTKERLDLAAEGELDSKEKRELRQDYEALGVSDEEIPDKVKQMDEVLVWKEENGSCKVAFVYSNNYRDDDGFPEIIEEKAHKAFAELTNSGVVDYPEMWHWHVDGTRWGQIDYILYHDGFSVALGTVDPGHEVEAQALATKENVGVSHGMIKRYLLRDEQDPSHIQFYISKEISDLPLGKAANKLTGLAVFDGDVDMEVKGLKDKAEYLKGLGYSDEKIAQIETMMTTRRKQAEDEGRESKEQTGQTQETQEETQKEGEVKETKEIPVLNGLLTKEEKVSLFKEIAEGMMEIFGPVLQSHEALMAGQTALKAEIDELREEKAKKVISESPDLSFKALLNSAVFGGDSARIHGGSALAKDKPAETEHKEADEVSPYGIPVISTALKVNRQYQNGELQ